MLEKGSRFLVIAVLAVAAACGAPTTASPPMQPPPKPETQATLVGPLCHSGTSCTCRDASAAPVDEGVPQPPFKRFEVRVGPHPNDLWVTVGDDVLYKSKERATECFYLDLVPGKHAVIIRGSVEHNLAARVAISERSAGGPWWYPTFEFDCGNGGPCDQDGYEDWKAGLARFDRNLHAPCGSTRIRGIEWQTGRLPDGLRPADIQLQLVLDVYEFATSEAPGTCKGARRDAARSAEQ